MSRKVAHQLFREINRSVRLNIMLYKLRLQYFRRRGVKYLIQGNCKKAVKIFSKVLQICSSASDKYNLGLAYLGMNKYKEALDCFKAVQELEPNNMLNLLSIGETYLLLEKWDNAIAIFYKLVSLEPSNLQYHNYLDMAQTPEKREKHIHCRRLIYQGDQEIRNRNFEAALEKFESALQLNKENPYVYNSIGIIYFKHYKDIKKAISYFERALKLSPTNRIFSRNFEKCQAKLK